MVLIVKTLSLKLDPHEVRPSTSLDTLFFHIAICVGGSPIENPEIEPTLRKNFDEETYKKIVVFYCPVALIMIRCSENPS